MREFLLNKIKATGTTTGDVYFPQTKLLLPFDGSNGATTTTDESNTNGTATFYNGAQISTAQSKFGGSSLHLDGSDDYIDLAANSKYVIAANADFTFECWIKTSVSSQDNSLYRRVFMLDGPTGTATGNLQIAMYSSATGIAILTGSGSWNFTGGSDVDDDNWHHIAIVRYSGTVTVYIDGSIEGSFASTVSITANSGSPRPRIGAYNSTTGVFNGYIDDLRWTNFARYTSAFTPPTTGHLTSAGDVNKQIIVNSTADGVAIGTGGINQARLAKSWVNFDADPSVSIRQSYNVSSITDTATGRFTINFSTAMLDADYCFSGSGGNQTGTTSGGRMVGPDGTKTTSALPVRYVTWGSTGTRNVYDNDYHCLIVFGN